MDVSHETNVSAQQEGGRNYLFVDLKCQLRLFDERESSKRK